MSYKTVLVHLDAGIRRRERLDLAVVLAKRYEARLIGLFAAPAPAAPVTPEAAPVVMSAVLEERRQAAEVAALEFRDSASQAHYSANSEWYATTGDAFPAVAYYAKYADLVVAGQADPDGWDTPRWFTEELVMAIGRPVLYVPYAGRFEDCGKRILVAWDASREAARALKDALPFLQKAEAAEVVTFDAEKLRPNDPELPPPDMRAYLARQGATATVTTLPKGDIDVGSAILARAADHASDLIVMGAYSHSRVRELVLGGATRVLFESMTAPTLMSH